MSSEEIRLNIGCGSRPLAGYINLDQDTVEQLRVRYPNIKFDDSLVIQNEDIFSLPYASQSVLEVNADGLLEHLSFKEESRFLKEVLRVLKPGGKFTFSVPDFEEVCKIWLQAEDDWKAFFSDDPHDVSENHWFGTFTYEYTNRWGYIVATLYGSQNGEGQFHKNCYSEGKIYKMLTHLGFLQVSTEKFLWKGNRDPMIRCSAFKIN